MCKRSFTRRLIQGSDQSISFIAFGSASGRHQQEVRGWKGKDQGVCPFHAESLWIRSTCPFQALTPVSEDHALLLPLSAKDNDGTPWLAAGRHCVILH